MIHGNQYLNLNFTADSSVSLPLGHPFSLNHVFFFFLSVYLPPVPAVPPHAASAAALVARPPRARAHRRDAVGSGAARFAVVVGFPVRRVVVAIAVVVGAGAEVRGEEAEEVEHGGCWLFVWVVWVACGCCEDDESLGFGSWVVRGIFQWRYGAG